MSEDTRLNEAVEKSGVTIEAAGEDKKDKKPAAKAASKDSKRQNGIGTWFKEIKAEAGKIIWPNKKELTKMTITVVVTSLLFGALIAGMDTVFRFITGILVDLI